MDHDFYTLDEAAKELVCEIKDLLKWGAAGKIELCIWYDGSFIAPESYEIEMYGAPQIPLPDMLGVIEFVAVAEDDIMRLFIDRNSPHPVGIIIEKLKWPGYLPCLYLKENGPDGRERCVSLTENDLYIRPATIASLKSELNKSPTESAAPCLDEENYFHAKELKIAVEAWTALFDKKEAGEPVGKIQERPGGAISAITSWLEKNYPGETKNAYERIARVINPNLFKAGGAPKRAQDYYK